MTSFPPKYPAKFAVGERALIVLGGYRGRLVKVIEVRPGWPYANYTVEHEVEGQFALNERELGKHKENASGTAATPAGREAGRIGQRRRAAGGEPPAGSEEAPQQAAAKSG